LIPNIRHLELFSAVSHHGSVSAAARALHLSQPAVTQAVAAMERAFDTRLLTRSARGVVLTATGRITAVRVDRALAQLREAFLEISRISKLERRPGLRAATTARLAAIVAVAEEGGFSNAARSAKASRATLHRTARHFERLLGVELFERTSHGVRATRESERLVRRIRLAGAEVRQAHAEVAATLGAERGETVIGAMPLARSSFLPAAVLAVANTHPLHQIRLLDGPYETLLRGLRDGRVDFLIGALRTSVPSDIVQEYLFDDPLAIILRSGHPLAVQTKKAPSLTSLGRYAWIRPHKDSPLSKQFDELMSRIPRRQSIVPIECNSLVAARAILLASDRLMLLSRHQVGQDVATGQLTTLPHPLGRVLRPIGLSMRRDWLPTHVQREVLAEIRRCIPRTT